MTTRTELNDLLTSKATKPVIFRFPISLLDELTSYHAVFKEENNIDVSLNKMVVSILTTALKADAAKRKRRKPREK